MSKITVKRSPVQLLPDSRRLVTKPYIPNDHAVIEGESRVRKVITRVLALTEEETTSTLADLRSAFSSRHPDLDQVFLRSFEEIVSHVPDANGLSTRRRLLVGAYFSHEYSIEGAALTNPSIAAHPDQEGVPSGWLRVVLTLRAIGEGHISSIEFRTGLIGPDGEVSIEPPGDPVIGERRSPAFDKMLFIEKLHEMGVDGDLLDEALRHLGSEFSTTDLDSALAELGSHEHRSTTVQHMIHSTRWVASSNYERTFPAESDLSQRVLYPKGPAESQGMEDARLVRFVEADGSVLYYATYTAFDGYSILPQLITTSDFETFRIATLNGRAASNKGMAIFPRLVGGRYAALARSDGESNFLMMSDDVRRWDETQLIQV
ncbi:MAG: glycosidase, partial [Acidimicrobiia bacterium]